MKKAELRHRGFTLLEIFLVILILSVLTGISIPRFSKSCKGFILRENAQIFISQIRYARKMALIKGKPFFVVLSPENSELRVGDSPDMSRDSSVFLEKYRFSKGLSVEAEPLFITFKPEGNSDPFVFTIMNRENRIVITADGKPGNLSEEETAV